MTNVYKRLLIAVWAVVMLLGQTTAANASASFFLGKGENFFVGKGFDGYTEHGVVLANPSNQKKVAIMHAPSVGEENVMQWTAKYSSITFNQMGKDLPMGGMNSRGLVVEVLDLAQTEFPPKDKRAAIMAMQWIQYQLDTAKSVGEVINSDQHVRITQGSVGSGHFFVADATGQAAVIEFIAGKRVVHTAESLPVKAITNSSYKEAIVAMRGFKEMPLEAKLQTVSASSLGKSANLRCSILADRLKLFNEDQPLPTTGKVFEILSYVKIGNYKKNRHTMWSLAYDISDRVISFKTKKHNAVKSIHFEELGKIERVAYIDLQNSVLKGNVSGKFQPYTQKLDKALWEKTQKAIKIEEEAKRTEQRK